jgi:hypothetical protein
MDFTRRQIFKTGAGLMAGGLVRSEGGFGAASDEQQGSSHSQDRRPSQRFLERIASERVELCLDHHYSLIRSCPSCDCQFSAKYHLFPYYYRILGVICYVLWLMEVRRFCCWPPSQQRRMV